MASNLPEKDAFVNMSFFDIVATKIHQTFDPLIEQLIARRDAHLQRVHELRKDYSSKESTRLADIEELETVQQRMQGMKIKANSNLELHEQAKQVYQQGMKKLESSATFLCPVFRCHKTDTIRQLISELGEIVPCEIPDYSLKKEPVLTVGKLGSGANELDTPRGVEFDESTELMYIADYGNSRVQIVSPKGEFVVQFGNDKLMRPWGIAIDTESIFVTDTGHHALFQFGKKDLKFLNRTGTKGNKQGLLIHPHGVCIDTNGDVLVANNYNHRLTIFSQPLEFKSCIGIGQLYRPQDVKVSADRIVVLDWSPKCVHFFSKEGQLLSSCVSRGETQVSLVAITCFLCLDAANNIIISDRYHHAIIIFTESGHHLHTLGRGEFIYPYGICITKLGTLCVVSHNTNYPLQCL